MGFTLVEVLISLGITASALLILVGFIVYIMDASHSSQGESIAVLISNQVRTRLLTNPAWPPGTENRALSRAVDEHGMTTDSFTWDALYFDDQGIELKPADAEDAIYQASCTSAAAQITIHPGSISSPWPYGMSSNGKPWPSSPTSGRERRNGLVDEAAGLHPG